MAKAITARAREATKSKRASTWSLSRMEVNDGERAMPATI
jgi:hypothetical protein